MSLTNKKVVIIGGSSGIGLGVAIASLDAGATVYISSSSKDKVAKAVASLGAPDRAFGQAVDAKSDDGIKTLVEWVNSHGQRKGIDHIVTTAGEDLASMDLHSDSLDVDSALGTLLSIRQSALLRAYKLGKGYLNDGASFVLTSGALAVKPQKGTWLTTTMAASTVALCRALALELAPKIRVNVVLPGAIVTPLWDNMFSTEEMKEQMKEVYAKATPLERLGVPADVAGAYVYLMSSPFATGAQILVDGGISI